MQVIIDCVCLTFSFKKEDLLVLYDFVCEQKYEGSENYLSSLGSRGDRLVQICHGATGFAFSFLKMYEIYEDNRWKEKALACGDVIWTRGLLKKGVGLCHGISGGGIAMLKLYQISNDDIWLKRAKYFANFAIQNTEKKESPLVQEPDDPYGLLNCVGGLILFLLGLDHIVRGGKMKIPLPFWDIF